MPENPPSKIVEVIKISKITYQIPVNYKITNPHTKVYPIEE